MHGRLAVCAIALTLFGCASSYVVPRDDDAGPPHDGTFAADAIDAASEHELWVEDTLGWRVRFECSRGQCTPPDAVPDDFPITCPEAMPPVVAIVFNGRFLELNPTCSSDGGWYAWPEMLRPIVCESDTACDRLDHVSDARPSCVDGLCQVPDAPLDPWDVSSLCAAEIPRPPAALTVLSERLMNALDLATAACPGATRCEVPSECAR